MSFIKIGCILIAETSTQRNKEINNLTFRKILTREVSLIFSILCTEITSYKLHLHTVLVLNFYVEVVKYFLTYFFLFFLANFEYDILSLILFFF